MRALIFFILFSNILFAQYDSTMYELIKTTYARSFDTHIVYKYLHSNSEQKTKAAILSIAQSEDTLFVPKLLNLDSNKYGKEICFALAQIGKCDQSINFLWKYLYSSPLPKTYPKIFFAIGKIGNGNDLKKLVEFYNSFDGPIFPYEGISEAILQFQIRGIKSDDSKLILETEITHQLSSPNRIIKALCVLSRYGGSENLWTDFENFLNGSILLNSIEKKEIELKQFVLMNIKKEVFITSVQTLVLDEVHKNPLLLIQLVKILHLLRFNTNSFTNLNLNLYFELLNDVNPNVALQAAISIKNIKDYINDSLKIEVKSRIDEMLFDQSKPMGFRGELLLSRYEIFGNYQENEKIINKLNLPIKYQIQFYAKNQDSKKAAKKLFELFGHTYRTKDEIEVLQELLEIKDKITYSSELRIIFLHILKSEKAPLISIVADGIDSVFIAQNSKKLREIISKQINIFKDNSDFLEATMSLINLSKKIDSDFYISMIEKTKSSTLYSIRKFVSSKTEDKRIGYKELDKFENIWSNSFKYTQAIIKTSKGDITIQFNSELAPISVANFCMLADQKFYIGIAFHRVVPGFVIQAGDPTATGWGGPGYDIVSEFTDTDFGIGYVGMASAGKDTESSQFFIMQGSHPYLDSRYTLFAKVIEGMAVVYSITEEDLIISIELN